MGRGGGGEGEVEGEREVEGEKVEIWWGFCGVQKKTR